MTSSFQARRLDVAAFAQAEAALSGHDELQKYERLAQEARAPKPDLTVNWSARGEHRRAIDGVLRPALHLQAHTVLPLTCQRCLGEVRVPLALDRHLVFAPDEVSAAALDDESDDDVLALSAELDLHALIEDELLMALPLVPRHEQCPDAVPMAAQDADFDAGDKPHPFAALAALKSSRRH